MSVYNRNKVEDELLEFLKYDRIHTKSTEFVEPQDEFRSLVMKKCLPKAKLDPSKALID